jgi:hypothetical protein
LVAAKIDCSYDDDVPVELAVALSEGAAVDDNDAKDENELNEDDVNVGLGLGGAVSVPDAVVETVDKPDCVALSV